MAIDPRFLSSGCSASWRKRNRRSSSYAAGTQPAITGTFGVGNLLTAAPGTWVGALTPTFQWFRGRAPIDGATASTYTMVSGDELSFIEVAVMIVDPTGGTSVVATARTP